MKRPFARQALPEDYRLSRRLDLIKDRKLLITLSLASLIVFVVSWIGLSLLLITVRPNLAADSMTFSVTAGGLGAIFLSLLVLLGVVFAMVTLHEAIHGLFFRLFTGGRVSYAFKGAYAYAAAPDWFIRNTAYRVISLAPLVLITVFGFIGLLLAPAGWIFPLLLLVTMNAAGAVGDVYVFFLLARLPGDVLVRDFGEQMEIYTRQTEKTSP